MHACGIFLWTECCAFVSETLTFCCAMAQDFPCILSNNVRQHQKRQHLSMAGARQGKGLQGLHPPCLWVERQMTGQEETDSGPQECPEKLSISSAAWSTPRGSSFPGLGQVPPSTFSPEASVPGEGSRPLFPTRTGDKGGKEAAYNLGGFHQGTELLSPGSLPAEILSELRPPTQALNFPSGFRHLSTPLSPNRHSVRTHTYPLTYRPVVDGRIHVSRHANTDRHQLQPAQGLLYECL